MPKIRSKNAVHLASSREYGPIRNRKLAQLAEDRAAHFELEETVCKLPVTVRSTFLMCFSPDGRKVASTHGDHRIYVCEVSTGKLLQTLEGHPRTPWCLAFHPTSNDLLASGCLGGEVRVWDLLGGGSELWVCPERLVITSLAFHPQEKFLALATLNRIHFWDWSRPEPFAVTKTAHEREKVRLVKFSPSGDYLLTGICNISKHDSLAPPQMPTTSSEMAATFGDVPPRHGGFSPAPLDSLSAAAITYQRRNNILSRLITMYQRLGQILPQAMQEPSANIVRVLRRMEENTALNPSGLMSSPSSSPSTSWPQRRFYGLYPPRGSRGGSSFSSEMQQQRLMNDEIQALRRAQQYAQLLTEDYIRQRTSSIINRMPPTQGGGSPPLGGLDSSSPSLDSLLLPPAARSDTLFGAQTSASFTPPQPNLELMRTFDRLRTLCNRLETRMQHHSRNIFGSSASFTGSRGLMAAHRGILDALGLSESQRLSSLRHTPTGGATRSSSARSSAEEQSYSSCDTLLQNVRSMMTAASSLNTATTTTDSGLNSTLNPAPIPVISVTPSSASPPQSPEPFRIPESNARLSADIRDSSTRRPVALDLSGSAARTTLLSPSSAGVATAPPVVVTPTTTPASSSSARTFTTSSRRFPSMALHRLRNLSDYFVSPLGSDAQAHVDALLLGSGPSSSSSPPLSEVGSASSAYRAGDSSVAAGSSTDPADPTTPVAGSADDSTHSVQNDVSLSLVNLLTRLQESLESLSDAAILGASGNQGTHRQIEEVRQRISEILNRLANVSGYRERLTSLRDQIYEAADRMQRRGGISGSSGIGSGGLGGETISLSEAGLPDLEQLLGGRLPPTLEDGVGIGGLRGRPHRSSPSGTSTQQWDLAYCLWLVEMSLQLTRQMQRILAADYRLTQLHLQQQQLDAELAAHSGAGVRSSPTLDPSPPSAAAAAGGPPTPSSSSSDDDDADDDDVAGPPTGPPVRPSARFDVSSTPFLSFLRRRNSIRRRPAVGPFGATLEDISRAHAASVVNLVSHRIQYWDINCGALPQISDSTTALVVDKCKIHNDGSVDVSPCGTLLAALVPDSISVTLSVFSLRSESRGQCLYTWGFGPNAVSVSFSPLSRYIVVGLASSRYLSTEREVVAQIFRLGTLPTGRTGSTLLEHVGNMSQPGRVQPLISLNCVRWLPRPGEGLIYGTNRGTLCICRPLRSLCRCRGNVSHTVSSHTVNSNSRSGGTSGASRSSGSGHVTSTSSSGGGGNGGGGTRRDPFWVTIRAQIEEAATRHVLHYQQPILTGSSRQQQSPPDGATNSAAHSGISPSSVDRSSPIIEAATRVPIGVALNASNTSAAAAASLSMPSTSSGSAGGRSTLRSGGEDESYWADIRAEIESIDPMDLVYDDVPSSSSRRPTSDVTSSSGVSATAAPSTARVRSDTGTQTLNADEIMYME